jgi:hypothetical protein
VTTNPIPARRSPSHPTEEVLPFRTLDCPEEARQLLKQGLVRSVIADVMVAFDVPDSQQVRTLAAELLIPQAARVDPGRGSGWVVGFSSAAWLHTGFTPTPEPPSELHVIVPPGRRRPRTAGVRGRQVVLTPEQVTYLGAVPVTDPVRTAVDVARDLSSTDAVPALHRLGELCGVRPHDVLETLTTMRYARGAANARRTIKLWTDG